MKLSFSTLGCPEWSFNEIISTAKDLALDGVEIRGLAKEIFAPHIKEFLPENIEKTKGKLNLTGLEIPILTSGSALADEEHGQTAYNEAYEYVNLASSLGSKYIRVMGTNRPEPTFGNFRQAAKLYKDLCEYAKQKKVMPLIETNGILASSKEMLEFLKETDSSNMGVLWDIHHTVRYYYEKPDETVNALGKYIKHVHVKDSAVRDSKIEYRMMGYGDIPVLDSINALKKIGYDGYLSLEWLKRYNPDLQEPAIVFSHYANYINNVDIVN